MVLARVLSFPLAFSPSSPAWRKLAGSELLRRLRQDRCCMILYGLRMLGAAPIQRANPSASAAARNGRQACISPASDALAWLRACWLDRCLGMTLRT